MDERAYEPSDVLEALLEAIMGMQSMNAEESGWRSRQLSIAITETETAFMWAKAAFRAKGANVSDWD